MVPRLGTRIDTGLLNVWHGPQAKQNAVDVGIRQKISRTDFDRPPTSPSRPKPDDPSSRLASFVHEVRELRLDLRGIILVKEREPRVA